MFVDAGPRPQDGIHWTRSIQSRALLRRPVLSIEMNHLLGGPEDDGVLAAPAVRVAVDDLLFEQQPAELFELGSDRRVRIEDELAGEKRERPAVKRPWSSTGE